MAPPISRGNPRVHYPNLVSSIHTVRLLYMLFLLCIIGFMNVLTISVWRSLKWAKSPKRVKQSCLASIDLL